jgi:hypothetical protein
LRFAFRCALATAAMLRVRWAESCAANAVRDSCTDGGNSIREPESLYVAGSLIECSIKADYQPTLTDAMPQTLRRATRSCATIPTNACWTPVMLLLARRETALESYSAGLPESRRPLVSTGRWRRSVLEWGAPLWPFAKQAGRQPGVDRFRTQSRRTAGLLFAARNRAPSPCGLNHPPTG